MFKSFWKTLYIHIINDAIFGETKLLNIKCVFWFPLQRLSETFLILTVIKRDIIINVGQSSCNVHVNYVRDSLNVNVRGRFSKKNPEIWDCCSMRKDWRTDGRQKDKNTDKTRGHKCTLFFFRNFANGPKN